MRVDREVPYDESPRPRRLRRRERRRVLRSADRSAAQTEQNPLWAPLEAGEILREALARNLEALLELSEQQLIEQRYRKFRAMGRFLDDSATKSSSAD